MLVLTLFGTLVTIKCKYSSEMFIFPAYINHYMGLETCIQVKHGEMVGLYVAELHMGEVY